MESVTPFNGSNNSNMAEFRDKVGFTFLPARQNTELGNCQANLNEVQVLLSRNSGCQDVNDGSVVTVEESPRTTSVGKPRKE